MPSFPKQPTRPTAEAQPSNWRAFVDNRSAHQRGYGRLWRAKRAAILAAEPLCRLCFAKGLYVSASQVDHIVPKHRGGSDDTANLQPICRECHRHKTATERTEAAARLVITGEPGTGKSTWVKERAKPGDLVWDLDDVASVLSFGGAPIPRELRGQLPWATAKATLVMRDALIDWLKLTTLKAATLYLIVTNRDEARRIADRIGAEVVDMVSQDACQPSEGGGMSNV